jgi:putative NAD(P)-binding protein
MAHPILVTGAAGRVGAVGRTVTELLLKQGKAVRAMVRKEDERAQALRDMGAEVVVGDLLDLDSMHGVIAGCETMYFSMSISDAYLAATVNAVVVAKHHGVKAFITGPQSENMHFYAQEYSKALGRTITFQDIPVERWRDGLLGRGLPVHLVKHLATMADLHRAGRYDRMSDDVLALTGQGPLSVQEFVRKNAATFTASARGAG